MSRMILKVTTIIVLEPNARHKPETYQVEIFFALPLLRVSIDLFKIGLKFQIVKEDESKSI